MRNRDCSENSEWRKYKMGVDKTTAPDYVNIVVDKNVKYLNKLSKQAEVDDQNDGENKKMSINLDGHSFSTEEFYYDECENELHISGEMQSAEGSTGIYLTISVSDTVYIDFLQGALKKLNKLKTAMEALK